MEAEADAEGEGDRVVWSQFSPVAAGASECIQ
jgi:hypothetical protein